MSDRVKTIGVLADTPDRGKILLVLADTPDRGKPDVYLNTI